VGAQCSVGLCVGPIVGPTIHPTPRPPCLRLSCCVAATQLSFQVSAGAGYIYIYVCIHICTYRPVVTNRIILSNHKNNSKGIERNLMVLFCNDSDEITISTYHANRAENITYSALKKR
jgi:hypothetical protein